MDRTRTGDGYPIDLQSTALTTQPPSLIDLKIYWTITFFSCLFQNI